jgi:hypothetical protein
MFCTQSKVFDLWLIVTWHLPGSTNLQKRVTSFEVHRIVSMNPFQVDDVLEVPTDENVNPGHRSKGDMQRISAHRNAYCTFPDICVSEFLSFGRNRNNLNVPFRGFRDSFNDSFRGWFQFAQRKLGQYYDQ